MFNNKEFIEHTRYSGNYYALSKKEIETKSRNDMYKDKKYMCIMDKEGVKQMLAEYGTEKIKVIYVNVPVLTSFRRTKEKIREK